MRHDHVMFPQGDVGETGGNYNISQINAHYAEHVFFLNYLFVPQSTTTHVLSKRITAFRVLIVTHFDDIE